VYKIAKNCVTPTIARDNTHQIVRHTLTISFPNMSGTSVCKDKRIGAAVDLLLKAPMLTVSQGMRAANFNREESKDRTLQMQVRRALQKKRKVTEIDANPFQTPPVGVGTSVTAISSLSTTSASSSGGGDNSALFPQPKLKRVRRTASAMQLDRANTLLKRNHYKEAVKRATLEYAAESKNPAGKSASQIAAEIKLQHDGVGPDARTITRYVNEYNHVGMSPLKTGKKNIIPRWAFQSACMAFETYVSINQLNGISSLNTRNKLSKILE